MLTASLLHEYVTKSGTSAAFIFKEVEIWKQREKQQPKILDQPKTRAEEKNRTPKIPSIAQCALEENQNCIILDLPQH